MSDAGEFTDEPFEDATNSNKHENSDRLNGLYREILTDPNEHSDDNFAYLVHATRAFPKDTINLINDYLTNHKQTYSTSLIGVFNEEQAREKLGHDYFVHNTEILGDVGFILKPKTNDAIKVAFNGNIASGSIVTKEYKNKIMSPRRMLTENDHHNELVVDGGQIDVVGAFYREFSAGQDRAEEMSKIASELLGYDIPVIRIPEQITDRPQVYRNRDNYLTLSSFDLINGSIEIYDGDLNLSIDKIPSNRDVKLPREIKGSFGIGVYEVEASIKMPENVDGNFEMRVNYNYSKNLVEFPKYVGGDFVFVNKFDKEEAKNFAKYIRSSIDHIGGYIIIRDNYGLYKSAQNIFSPKNIFSSVAKYVGALGKSLGKYTGLSN